MIIFPNYISPLLKIILCVQVIDDEMNELEPHKEGYLAVSLKEGKPVGLFNGKYKVFDYLSYQSEDIRNSNYL